MKTMNWAMVLGLMVSTATCGGTTETSEGQAGAGGQAGSGGQDASTDASTDAANDATGDAASDVTDETTGWEECFFGDDGTVSTNLKLCSGGTDSCVVKEHQLDCCGSIRYVGISPGSEAEFDVCEGLWRAHFPACGCAAGLPKIEQPASGEVQDSSEVDVGCMNCTMDSCVCMTVFK